MWEEKKPVNFCSRVIFTLGTVVDIIALFGFVYLLLCHEQGLDELGIAEFPAIGRGGNGLESD